MKREEPCLAEPSTPSSSCNPHPSAGLSQALMLTTSPSSGGSAMKSLNGAGPWMLELPSLLQLGAMEPKKVQWDPSLGQVWETGRKPSECCPPPQPPPRDAGGPLPHSCGHPTGHLPSCLQTLHTPGPLSSPNAPSPTHHPGLTSRASSGVGPTPVLAPALTVFTGSSFTVLPQGAVSSTFYGTHAQTHIWACSRWIITVMGWGGAQEEVGWTVYAQTHTTYILSSRCMSIPTQQKVNSIY